MCAVNSRLEHVRDTGTAIPALGIETQQNPREHQDAMALDLGFCWDLARRDDLILLVEEQRQRAELAERGQRLYRCLCIGTGSLLGVLIALTWVKAMRERKSRMD